MYNVLLVILLVSVLINLELFLLGLSAINTSAYIYSGKQGRSSRECMRLTDSENYKNDAREAWGVLLTSVGR